VVTAVSAPDVVSNENTRSVELCAAVSPPATVTALPGPGSTISRESAELRVHGRTPASTAGMAAEPAFEVDALAA
jgi:hypothetical protein